MRRMSFDVVVTIVVIPVLEKMRVGLVLLRHCEIRLSSQIKNTDG